MKIAADLIYCTGCTKCIGSLKDAYNIKPYKAVGNKIVCIDCLNKHPESSLKTRYPAMASFLLIRGFTLIYPAGTKRDTWNIECEHWQHFNPNVYVVLLYDQFHIWDHLNPNPSLDHKSIQLEPVAKISQYLHDNFGL